MRILHSIYLIAFFFTVSYSVQAQVTTSSMSGRITDVAATPLPMATVQATHIPSGTKYATVTNNEGYYYLEGMLVGGPYSVYISFIGHLSARYDDIILTLGKTYSLHSSLKEKSLNLSDVEIISQKTSSRGSEGSATGINNETIKNMPSISRSINDFTLLSPLAGAGNSFAGRDGRYNNITIDGAAFNNNYGLSANNLPGGDAQPISLDAISEIAVNIAPYDIRQSNFTGANINAVTKSGSNTFGGTAYSFLRPKSLTGNLVDETVVANANDRATQLYGMSLGSYIVKDKVFIFVNGEYENQSYPGIEWSPSVNGVSDAAKKIARTTVHDLETMKQFLLEQYGYDPGSFSNNDAFNSRNHKFLARVDWNISNNHKFTLRYNDVVSTNDSEVNPNSAPRPRSSSNRNSQDAISFSNSNYTFKNIVRSLTGELNSRFGDKVSNSLLMSFTRIRDTRGSNSKPFPFVDIYKDGDMYMSFGYELFTYNTDLTNDALNFSDNVSIYLGKHKLTAGVSFNYLYFKNTYMRYALGYYRYASPEDFINNARPTAFGLTYGYNGNDLPGFQLDFGMGAIYVQDEWNVNENLSLTAGVRLEAPFYMNQLPDNPAVNDTLTFYGGETVRIDKWAKSKLLASPRLGFSWNINGDRSIYMRGGTGIFTGFVPFVWFTNQPNDNGMIQNTIEWSGNLVPENLRFETDFHNQIAKYPNLFPMQAAAKAPGQISFIDRDFKLPQVWRSSLAFDFQLPYDMIFTAEGVYGKDINAIFAENINECDPSGIIKEGDLERLSWWKDGKKTNTLQPMAYAMKLTNAHEGYQYFITGQLVKNFSYGLSGAFAYTFGHAKDLSANAGSSLNSTWNTNVAVNSLNAPALSYSAYSVPHRLMGAVTWRIESGNNLGFTVSLLYQGAAQGRYSYTYNGDMNGDGNNADLMYIPRNINDIQFVDKPTMAAKEQAQTFWDYLEQDTYLSAHKGSFAERNAVVGPWLNRFDMKLIQDIFSNFGTERRYTLQLSLDVLNIGNLLNPKWGCYQIHGLENNRNIRPLTFEGLTDDGRATYSLNASGIESFNENARFVKDVATRSTWGAQMGLRFIF
ncbi:MAG: TonB-dependent receptor [Bacteroidales bacterium]|nr:TonB-dependent receptor [Bacteroidales bacterium]